MLVTLASARAQISGALQQVDNDQHRRKIESAAKAAHTGEIIPETYPGEAGDVGELTVMEFQTPRPTWFEASADVQYLETDNMFLTERRTQDADELISTVQAALTPPPFAFAGGEIAPRIGYRHQWYDFGLGGQSLDGIPSIKLHSYDFNASTLFGDLNWSHADWIFGVGADFTRLFSTQTYNEYYREYVPRWSAERTFAVNPTATLVVGYEGDYRVTELGHPFLPVPPDYNDRTDHSLFATWTQTFGPHFVVQPNYRFKYTHFTTGMSRDDYMNSVGLTLYWFFTPQISARVFVNYDNRLTSAKGVSDYESFSTGLGLNLTFRF